ncbi:aminopeptidase N [Candidatus Kryptonium thompsonii]|uniref:Aminopeptidase N n=4 Tax=Candidatus Kryptonium thompsonii TaxID=1633631 RepID=A0A0P1LJK6_9BACT|nr:M1 family aminopeptidase [Candidatus Kryptonium thompsoni]CUS78614.1 aminopeptidase N [Candidatus Kryptonium thompsoni]CUS81916.1 aminopeptidase N [Candidatus Kryptonium thompsoni]CUS82572.1 aminopeptidase N [Candidatus Kryptonium thompsoni]CUS95092.1 aminopeptidase N [Candidatus Kryptonium thompsoni]CUT01789.1 aminopeptidase N [Candidatus Kryptonium thompsoni]
MKKFKIFVSLVLIFALFFNLSLAQRPRIYYKSPTPPPEHPTRERTYDVIHIKIEVKLDEKQKTVDGKVTTKFVPLRPDFKVFELDAAEMKIGKVYFVNGKPLNFDFDSLAQKLKIYLDRAYSFRDTLSVVVEYFVSNPRKGLYFIQPDSAYPDKPYQIWSQGQPEDNHYWFPCYDFPNDKATSEVIATVNKNFVVISNGKLLSVKEDRKRGLKTYHWFMDKPHSSYLISIVAGEYVKLQDYYLDIPLEYYVYKTNAKYAKLSFEKTPEIMKFFSEKIGYKYPYNKYAQTIVEDFIYGGMENITATTLTSTTIHDERAHLDVSSDGLVAHEMAHQWWGDLLTCRSWEHAWLNEGFATYFTALYFEYARGKDEFQYSVYNMQRTAKFADMSDKKPTVWNRYFDPTDLFGPHIYQRGGAILNMIRFILGDELFWKAINYYARKYEYQNVETNDFKIAIEEATGYNLKWFFDQWLYKAGYPIFEVSYVYNDTTKTLRLTVEQIQVADSLTPEVFKTPVDVEITTKESSKTYRIFISERKQTFDFSVNSKPLMVIFDKGNWILKDLFFEKSKDELIYQALNASEMIDRLWAVQELGRMVDKKDVVDVMMKLIKSGEFYAVRQEAINNLGKLKDESTARFLIDVFKNEQDSKVRRSIVEALKEFKFDFVAKFLAEVIENDKSYYVIASAVNSLALIDSVNRMSVIKNALAMDSHQEIIRTTALRRLSDFKNTKYEKEAIDILKKYSVRGNHPSVRITAISTLSIFADKEPSIKDFIFGMVNTPEFFVRMVIYNVLGDIGDQEVLNYLKLAEKKELDGRMLQAIWDAIARLERKLKG